MKFIRALLPFLIFSSAALAQTNPITTGQFFTDEATLHSLAFRWLVTGDDNKNAVATVQYRQQGASTWLNALDLERVNGEVAGLNAEVTCGNFFAGSIMNLNPGTAYDVKIDVSDPDGVSGTTEQLMTVTTRAVPTATTSGTTRNVYPSCSGSVSQPCYTTIASAALAAQPGELVLIHDGNYSCPGGALSQNLVGKATSASKPIVFRGTNRDAVVISGTGSGDCFDLNSTKYIFVETLTLQNSGRGVYGRDAEFLTVRQTKISGVSMGITGLADLGVRDRYWYIADNDITGTNAFWDSAATCQGGGQTYGIMVLGKGHTFEYNRVHRFLDCIAHPEGLSNSTAGIDWANPPSRAIDINNNEVSECQDDGITADYSYSNYRVWNNRVTNVHSSFSLQPIYCGPAYFFRNVAYNSPQGNTFKTHNYPSGFYIMHNTVSDAMQALQVSGGWHNGRIWNNLFMGASGRFGPTLESGDADHPLNRIDYNGLDAVPSGATLVHWNSGTYQTNAAFATGTSRHYQQNGITVGYDEFVSCARPLGETCAASPPDGDPGQTYSPTDCDFTLKSTAKSIDKALRLSNINDSFNGAAPDIGAYELGSPKPLYGPRTNDSLPPSAPQNLRVN